MNYIIFPTFLLRRSYGSIFGGDWRLYLCRKSRVLYTVLFIVLLLTLAGCSGRNNRQAQGIVTLWHSLGPEETAVLNQSLASFSDIHPAVTVRSAAVDIEQLRNRFEQSAAAGLGPDLILAPSRWIMPLADAGLIRNIDDHFPRNLWERYLPSSVETVRYGKHIYGVPESLRLIGLYYNKRLVEEPPQTLELLLAEAMQGKRVGLSPTFVDSFWGIQAFGGQLFDKDERVTLDNGGFANWLAWLKATSEVPNVVLDQNSQTLTNLFIEGELAYLVAGSWLREDLQNGVGEEYLGVAPLPEGPIQAAGPLLETNAFLFSMASSSHQLSLAIELASFVTNAEQQTLLMRRAGRIPTNLRVRNNPGIDPVAYAFRTQARTAVPLRNSDNFNSVLELGDHAFNRALQGVAAPVQVARDFTREVNEANDFPVVAEADEKCVGRGDVAVWYGKGLAEGDALATVADYFALACPAIQLQFSVKPMSTLAKLLVTGTGSQPDLILISSDWLATLALNGVLQPLNGFINPQQLQSYHPGGVAGLRLNGQLYGVPYVLMPQALYVNTSLVSESAENLDELLAQGQAGNPTAMPLTFTDLYWGISAFGGTLFSEDGRVVLDQAGLVDWLKWLSSAQAEAGAVLSTNIETLRTKFSRGEVAYLIDRPPALAKLDVVSGSDFRVTQLPAGPTSGASPLLLTSGLALRRGAATEAKQLALEFIDFATNSANQTLLIRNFRLLPARVDINIAASDPLAVFADQAAVSTPYPTRAEMVAVEELGQQFYASLMTDEKKEDVEIEEIVRSTVEEINSLNGFEAPETTVGVEGEVEPGN